MARVSLRLTEFQVEKLQCGAGRVSPYQVTTYQGRELGTLGEIAHPAAAAANATSFDRLRSGTAGQWIRGLLGRVRLTG